jgi:hypothetical protein
MAHARCALRTLSSHVGPTVNNADLARRKEERHRRRQLAPVDEPASDLERHVAQQA